MDYTIEIEEKKEKKKPKKVALEGFGTFWSLYPRKVAKEVAMRSWCKLNLDEETRVKLMKGLEDYKKTPQWKKDDGLYIPHPATWLNQKRWEDEIQQKKEINNKYAKYV